MNLKIRGKLSDKFKELSDSLRNTDGFGREIILQRDKLANVSLKCPCYQDSKFCSYYRVSNECIADACCLYDDWTKEVREVLER
jgi:hypothetical protein